MSIAAAESQSEPPLDDLSERRFAHVKEEVLQAQTRVLDRIAGNQCLGSILTDLTLSIELQLERVWCAAYVMDGAHLLCLAAPACDPEYACAFNSDAPLHAVLPSCPTARPVVLVLERLPWMPPAASACMPAFEACLIQPIAINGAVLGWLVLHYMDSTPHRGDEKVAGFAARLAALAIGQQRLRQSLEVQTRYDPLTGLPNRAYLMDRLQSALTVAHERSEPLGVLFIDLDRFKQINDTLGHGAGDCVLMEVGRRLRQCLGKADLAGRIGGDEFALVLASAPEEDRIQRASRDILQALRMPYLIGEHELFVTASIGAAMFPKDGTSAGDLLRNADMAMYRVKKQGKNDLQFFHAEDDRRGLERLQLENALRRALENRELELQYQPIVGINGKLASMEALLSWRHPRHGRLTPKQFIPLAEETGLIVPIGGWVLQEACLQIARWRQAGYLQAKVSVNVSALQFERADFVDIVASALSLANLPPECLELEVTESFVMRDIHASARLMSRLRELGVCIAIDDFGTGYSSLSYLSQLPADALKIDQSFTRSLQDPTGSLPVVQTIVRLAHNMNLLVVAEGVETVEELDLLRLVGCDKVQGHLYGQSLRAGDAEALLARGDELLPIVRVRG